MLLSKGYYFNIPSNNNNSCVRMIDNKGCQCYTCGEQPRKAGKATAKAMS